MKRTFPTLAVPALSQEAAAIESLISQIARIYAIPKTFLTHATRSKSRTHSEARCVAAWVLFEGCKAPLRIILRRLGFHSHSAVLRCIRWVEDVGSVDEEFHQRLEAILKTLSPPAQKNPPQD